MLQRASLFSRSCQCHIGFRSRTFASRTGGLRDEKTKQVLEEIKKLEQSIERQRKIEEASRFEKVSDQDVATLYKELSSDVKRPPRSTKLAPDYLEKLRIRFLDTRQQIGEADSAPALLTGSASDAVQHGEGKSTSDLLSEAKHVLPSDITQEDFEQLIYANALAKRPRAAEEALRLMENYNLAPTTRCYNHLIDSYANTGDADKAVEAYMRLQKEGLTPDIYTYSTLIKAFVNNARLDDAIIVFERLKASSMIPTQPIFANIISGCVKADRIDKAWEIFDAMRLSYHQPDEVTFTLMLHACAKRGEVEKALNLFEDMTGHQLYPTDVTFNVLINACAKRPDYYAEGFELLHQMEHVYGFRPDRITYNTLLGACARKKDLERAKAIVRMMLDDPNLAPDHHSFTHLFHAYANFEPPRKPASETSAPETASDLTSYSLIPAGLPNYRSKVVEEAKAVFTSITTTNACQVTSKLVDAYLAVPVLQHRPEECADIYTKTFEEHGVAKTGYTFSLMLQHCYNHKDNTMVWKIWEDYQDFLEDRTLAFPHVQTDDLSTKKQRDNERLEAQRNEGWTEQHQKDMAVLMANTLARGNDLKNALAIVKSQFGKGSVLCHNPPTFQQFKTLYNKCVQLEDQAAKEELVKLCIKERRIKPVDWRFRK